MSHSHREPPLAARAHRFIDLASAAAIVFTLPMTFACGGRSVLTDGADYLQTTAGGSVGGGVGGVGGAGAAGGFGAVSGVGGASAANTAWPSTPERILAVSAGEQHSCAVLDNHHVKCWGINNAGQLGDGTKNTSAAPVDVSSLSQAVAVQATHSFSCALLSNGSITCWGYNNVGQLGIGSTDNQSLPTAVSGISTATAFGIGSQHGCAVVEGGNVWCWGYNQHGQLGDGSRSTRLTPVQVQGLTQALAVATAGEQTCALMQSGQVQCWGFNGRGELGDGTMTDSFAPVTVRGLTYHATSLALGDSHGCAALANGSVRCWGRNDQGQLATGNTGDATSSEIVPYLLGFWMLSAGFGSSAAVLMNGSAVLWGSAFDHVMTANGPGPDTILQMPTFIAGLDGAYAVTIGADHACALLSNSDVKCWGHNQVGQLGDGTYIDSISTPVTVAGLK